MIAEFDTDTLTAPERASHEALVQAHGRGRIDRLFGTASATVVRLRARGFVGRDIARELGRVVHECLAGARIGAAEYARRSIVVRAFVRQAVAATKGTTAVFDDDFDD